MSSMFKKEQHILPRPRCSLGSYRSRTSSYRGLQIYTFVRRYRCFFPLVWERHNTHGGLLANIEVRTSAIGQKESGNLRKFPGCILKLSYYIS